MAKKYLLSVLMLFMSLHAIYAQERPIKGKVTDANDGSGMPGVTIGVKGTTKGVITDGEGMYTVSAANGATLVFSYIGYETKEVTVSNQSEVNVALTSSATTLNETIVIGYGTLKKSDLTGAVGTVREAQLKERPSTSLNQALSGRMAGAGKYQLGSPGW